MRTFLAAHLAQRARPAVVVTHDLRDVLALAAEVVVLEAGKIVQRGSVAALRARPASDFVAELVDLPRVPGA
jgi:ABC-type sulfate/molybdate transport systems ATPase subunit